MVVCPHCGFENSAEARFCGGCAAPLEEAAPARESRKTVTVVFCDVTGSTALGERLDPESLRHVMARYFETMRAAIERHGGTVEKFIGDAVMAVFGVPVVHEDDALRAVRSAAEMRDALSSLNEELERDYGTRLELRIGVNTGEVVTGTEERLATGDPVNVAARLEQAAGPGEILVGRETLRLTRDAVEVEELEPLELKGKAEGVAAYRLRTVSTEAPARRLDVPMVGRHRELRLLEDAWERAVSERSCALFTLLGPAGVGKSRLVAEFLAGVDATVVRGRCLSYGEGITYWPVVEVVIQLGNLGHDLTSAPLAGLLGESAAPTSPEEIAWAVRRLFEEAASERPLAVVLDDIHWGEQTFLELIEHVATLSRGAPILLLCGARPELLDRRPGWGGGLLNATTVLLEPLSSGESDELIESLLAGAGLDDGLAARIRGAAEGNPLFLEEMVAMVEEGDGEVVVPPTVQALLAARLDQLDSGERGVLERGAVEGQVFHRGAVQALGTAETEVLPRLTALVRKEFVRPEPGALAGEDAYRFRHLLIRDAAYDALPKATRAELHERFADWLDEHGADLIERDEIVGYHLEQAYRYRAELGPVDEAGRELARRAAERLAKSGQTAYERSDVRAAAALLGRAVDLLPAGDTARLELLPEVALVLLDVGDFATAGALLDEAAAVEDERISARARLHQVELSSLTDPSSTAMGDLDELAEFVALFERIGDEAGLADAWACTARFRFYMGQCSAAESAYERAVEGARRLGDRRRERDWLEWSVGVKRFGPTPAADVLAFNDELLERAGHPPRLSATLQIMSASMTAMLGRFSEARAMVAAASPLVAEFGLVPSLTRHMEGGYVELVAGDAQAAANVFREGWDALGELGETGFRSTLGTQLAQALAVLGEDAEAEAVLDEVARLVQVDDFDPQTRMRSVRATILARRGETAEAERLAREAVAIVAPTDYIDVSADAHVALANVLAAAGRRDESAGELRTALELYERKGNAVRAAQVRKRLA
jgi:class 3 adenylate cyclase/tetratricopeptide (TPR) repeat protein